jgi:molecular chaperone DnaK
MNHSNVNSHSLGVLAHSRRTGQTRNVIVIPRNTPIPCAVSKTFGTARDNDTSVRVRIVEGEAPDPEACTHIGKCRIEGLPPGLPKGSPIVVTFSYSSEGRVEVSAVSEQGGASASTTIDRQIALNEASVDRETETLSGVNIL